MSYQPVEASSGAISSKRSRGWAACCYCAPNQVDEYEQQDSHLIEASPRGAKPPGPIVTRRSRRVSIPTVGVFHLDRLLPPELVRPSRALTAEQESTYDDAAVSAIDAPDRDHCQCSSSSTSSKCRPSSSEVEFSGDDSRAPTDAARRSETSEIEGSDDDSPDLDSATLDTDRLQGRAREAVYEFLGVRDVGPQLVLNSVSQSYSTLHGAVFGPQDAAGSCPVVAQWALQAGTRALGTPPGPQRQASPLASLAQAVVAMPVYSQTAPQQATQSPEHAAQAPVPASLVESPKREDLNRPYVADKRTGPTKSSIARRSDYRRNSIEEYMNEIESLSSIEGLTSSLSEGNILPTPKAVEFLPSSHDKTSTSLQDPRPVRYSTESTSCPSPRTASALSSTKHYFFNMASRTNKVTFVPVGSSDLSQISARSRSDGETVVDPMGSNLSVLIRGGHARLTNSTSSRAMAARLRFERKVPCAAIVLRNNEASMAMLKGFHVILKDGILSLCRGNQQKQYALADLQEVNCTSLAIKEAKEWIRASALRSQDVPVWPNEIDVGLESHTGQIVVLKYAEKRIPIIILFESEEDLRDFIELLGFAAKTYRRSNYHAIRWKLGD